MERKKARLPIFTERFRELQGERSNTEFADFLGISRQTVGFYCNGDRVPDAITLIQIAKKCTVSADWLLGLSDVRSSNADVRKFSEETGLSERCIEILKSIYKVDRDAIHRRPFEFSDTINVLVEAEPVIHVIVSISQYLNMPDTLETGYCVTEDGKIIKAPSFDELRSYELQSGDSNVLRLSANLLSDSILCKIQNELTVLKDSLYDEELWKRLDDANRRDIKNYLGIDI